MKPNNDANNYLISKKHSYYVFSLLFLLYMFDYIDRMVVSSLFPYIQRDWGLSDTQCAMLVSAVYWSIIIFSLPVSLLIDRWSRKKIIGLMAVVWSIATAACALTKNFTQLFTVRTAIGIGEAGYAPGGTAMISALFPEKKRAMIVGIWNTSIPLGSALGIAIGGLIAEHLGWRHAFGLVALPGLLVAILFFRIKDYKTVNLLKTVKEKEDTKEQVKMQWGDIVREFIRTRSLILTYFAFAGNMFVITALLVWLPTFFHRTDGISTSRAGLKSGVVMLLAIVGAPLGGFIADRWLKRRVNARLLFSSLSSLITAAILFTYTLGIFTGALQYSLLLLAGMTIASFAPAAIAVTQDVVHPGLRATSYSFCVIIQNLLGSSLGPIFIGAMSDRYDISTALRVLPLFTIIAGILFFIGSFFYERDLAKVEKVVLSVEN